MSTWKASASDTRPSSTAGDPDRDPESCTYEQLEEPVKYDLADILSGQLLTRTGYPYRRLAAT